MPTRRLLYLLICTLLPFSVTISQSIHPQNLFDTGLNMGYLAGHQAKGSDQEEAPIWAGNAAAEWLASWEPGAVMPITPTLETPNMAHLTMNTAMRKMAGCPEAYFNLRISLYQLGYTLGHAMAETNYDCSNCLRSELQKAAIEARTIGQLLRSEAWQSLADDLNAQAKVVDVNLTGQLASQQNAAQFGLVQAALDRVNTLLPDELIPCEKEESVEEEPEPTERTEETTEKPERKRQIIITVGYTGATLKGENGTTSQSGDGFYAGFNIYRGDPVFLLFGFDFFRNSAGKEYFIPAVSQVADPGEYIQGFRMHFGLGGYVVEKESFNLSIFGDARLLIGAHIDGNLLSLGDASTEKNPVNLNFGTNLSFGRFSVQTSYEFGLRPVITLVNEKMDYRMWNLGVGINF